MRKNILLLLAFMCVHSWTGAAEKKSADLFPANQPKVLIYSAIDSQYLADSLAFWGNNVGVNGFILSYIADWQVSKNQIFSHAVTLKKINTQGRQYGIDSNFLNVSLGSGVLPLWTDDKAWAVLGNHFRDIAELAKQTGTKGIALDTEPYTLPLFDSKAERFKAINRDILKAAVYQRGRETMQALTAVYPDIEVIVLPEGGFFWFNPDQETNAEYELWMDFFNGLASVKNNKGIVVAAERTYDVTNKNFLNSLAERIDTTMKEHVENPVFWKERCSLALGMWPLGKEYDNKAARFSAFEFKIQFAKAVTLSPKYVWIYDHGTAWFRLKAGDAVRYTRDGRKIWGKDYQQLPTDPDIDNYYSVLRNYKKQQ